jgi:hypothetical protein
MVLQGGEFDWDEETSNMPSDTVSPPTRSNRRSMTLSALRQKRPTWMERSDSAG